MSTVLAKLNARETLRRGNDYVFLVKRLPDRTSLTFQDDLELGALSMNIAAAINSALEKFKVDLEALLEVSSLHQLIDRAKKANEAVARVNIYVYGTRKESKGTGKLFSERKIYLQKPDSQRPGIAYENPQVIHFDNMQTLSTEYSHMERRTNPRKSNGADNLDEEVGEIYASLKRASRLRRLEGENCLKTQLLP